MQKKKMVKRVRNHKILNRPIVAFILLMFWGYVFYQIIGSIFLISLGDNYFGYGAAVRAIIALVMYFKTTNLRDTAASERVFTISFSI